MAKPTNMNKIMPIIERAKVVAAVKALGFDAMRITGIDMSPRSITVTTMGEPGITTTTTYMIKKD